MLFRLHVLLRKQLYLRKIFMTQDSQNIQPVIRRLSSRVSMSLFLAFVLLASQAIVLQHSHADDFSHQVDCSVCIEQSKNLDALPTAVSLPSVVQGGKDVSSDPIAIVSNSPSNIRSRGPPLAHS